MKTLLIKEFDFEAIHKFLDECTIENPITIYIDSGGGIRWQFYAVANRLNEMLDEGYKITLRIAYAASAAFLFCYLFKGLRLCQDEGDGMIHMGSTSFDTHRDIIRSNDPIERGRRAYYDKEELNTHMCWHLMTEEEQKQFCEGRDIYIDPDRMKEIFTQT